MSSVTLPAISPIRPLRKKQEYITMPELVKKLIVPPEKRTEYDCKLMAKALYVFITSIAAFKEGFLKADALAVARRAEMQTVDDKQTVFLQGEVGGDFYFVLQGSVAIKINNEVIKILGDKTAFGELAMQCKCKRSASVLGAEHQTRLLVINKKLYHRHMAKTHRREMASKFEFIKKLNAAKLSPDQIAILCTCIKMRKVKRNQAICSTEGPPKFLYYLIEGNAEQHIVDNSKFLREILRGHSPISKASHAKKLKGMIDKKPRKKDKLKLQRLAVLLTGQMFGEASWVYGQQAMATVIARSECKLWVISHAHVRQLVKTRVQVKHHLETVARMKIQFRLTRLDTLNRARKSLQPAAAAVVAAAAARSYRRSKTWANKNDFQSSPSSSSSFVSISVNDRSVKKAVKSPRSESIPRALSVSPKVKRAPTLTKCAQASLARNFFTTNTKLPPVFGSGVMDAREARKPHPYRNCDQLKHRLSDKYDLTNSVPRAPIVDGDPKFASLQKQLLTAFGKSYTINRDALTINNRRKKLSTWPW